MLDESKRKLQQQIGITDEDFDRHVSHPHNRKMLELTPEMEKYQIVAEAVQAKYCNAGIRPGTKLVFDLMPAMLISKETDCPLCVRAIYPVHDVVAGVMERILDGRDPEQCPELLADCLDPGLEKGGLGHVVFKVYARKIK